MKQLFVLSFIFISALSGCAQNDNKGQWLKENEKVEDSSDRKAVNGFGANLIVVKEPDKFIKEWLKPEQPNFYTTKTVKPDEKIGIIVLFAGCKPDSAGVCNTEVDYILTRPDGKELLNQKGLELWKETAPPKPNTHLGKAVIKLEMLKSNLIGEYKVKAKVYDKNADISFELKTQFTLENK